MRVKVFTFGIMRARQQHREPFFGGLGIDMPELGLSVFRFVFLLAFKLMSCKASGVSFEALGFPNGNNRACLDCVALVRTVWHKVRPPLSPQLSER